jgi:predicted transcriptional regulator
MPHSTSAPRLGDLERVVMERLWEAAASTGTAFAGVTVRDVHESFDGEREIAYTTVMTVLDRLAKKDLVTRERDGRAWRYSPADTREALTAQTMRRTLDDMDVTDRRAALLHFLDGASSDELADIKAALAEVEGRAAAAEESAVAARSGGGRRKGVLRRSRRRRGSDRDAGPPPAPGRPVRRVVHPHGAGARACTGLPPWWA